MIDPITGKKGLDSDNDGDQELTEETTLFLEAISNNSLNLASEIMLTGVALPELEDPSRSSRILYTIAEARFDFQEEFSEFAGLLLEKIRGKSHILAPSGAIYPPAVQIFKKVFESANSSDFIEYPESFIALVNCLK